MRTTNFTKHDFFYLLFEYFYEVKVLKINSYVGIFQCILALIQNVTWYLSMHIQKVNM